MIYSAGTPTAHTSRSLRRIAACQHAVRCALQPELSALRALLALDSSPPECSSACAVSDAA